MPNFRATISRGFQSMPGLRNVQRRDATTPELQHAPQLAQSWCGAGGENFMTPCAWKLCKINDFDFAHHGTFNSVPASTSLTFQLHQKKKNLKTMNY